MPFHPGSPIKCSNLDRLHFVGRVSKIHPSFAPSCSRLATPFEAHNRASRCQLHPPIAQLHLGPCTNGTSQLAGQQAHTVYNTDKTKVAGPDEIPPIPRPRNLCSVRHTCNRLLKVGGKWLGGAWSKRCFKCSPAASGKAGGWVRTQLAILENQHYIRTLVIHLNKRLVYSTNGTWCWMFRQCVKCMSVVHSVCCCCRRCFGYVD